MLASKLKPVKVSDFPSTGALKNYLINCINERRKGRQKGLITELVAGAYDPDADFVKVGKGSFGGKARGLAFISTQLKENPELQKKYKNVEIQVPKSLVLSTEGFDAFINDNDIKGLATDDCGDEKIARQFLAAALPAWLKDDLVWYLQHADYPLAVRSSSLLEDAQFQPFAGIYNTIMLPNNHPDPAVRLERLVMAIKLVYASTYFHSPKSYAQSTYHRLEDEKMAAVIQQLTGSIYGDYYYPAISGVGGIIESASEDLKADPSQGSHFFQNITSLGIGYLTISSRGSDYLNWQWLQSQPTSQETTYLNHVKLDHPLTIKIEGKKSRAVILP